MKNTKYNLNIGLTNHKHIDQNHKKEITPEIDDQEKLYEEIFARIKNIPANLAKEIH